MSQINDSMLDFNKLGINKELLEVLNRLQFTTPSPIQCQCIPAALNGKDIVGIAQTGTGKTLAFGVPMVQLLSQNNGQGLILLPTRELALQVNEVLQTIGRKFGLRTAVIIGGASSYQQIQAIRRKPHILVSTPGRLIDHLQQRNISLEKIKMIVLDEADRMFDIGFMPAIKQILGMAPRDRQTLLFSATMPKAIAEIAACHMKMPLRIEVAPSGTAAKNVEQELFIISKEAKIQLLDKILADTDGTVLVFSRTKHGAKKITANVRAMGHTATDIHSNKSLAQRKMALGGFKTGKFRVLVATDIASRGIDVNNISLVVNFDLPDNCEDYVHRIGRTGRADKFGKAVSFATPDERRDIRQIERLIKKTIPILALPVLPPRRFVYNSDKVINASIQFQSGRPFHSRNRNFRRR
ncbi:MAG: DEAD/DEAH box helicase [Patescibacteria group bacterium]|jgi:ATP-dependent RNA helicase RhlE